MTENKKGYKETMTWTRLPGLSSLKTRLPPVAVWVNSKSGQKGKEATDLSSQTCGRRVASRQKGLGKSFLRVQKSEPGHGLAFLTAQTLFLLIPQNSLFFKS